MRNLWSVLLIYGFIGGGWNSPDSAGRNQAVIRDCTGWRRHAPSSLSEHVTLAVIGLNAKGAPYIECVEAVLTPCPDALYCARAHMELNVPGVNTRGSL